VFLLIWQKLFKICMTSSLFALCRPKVSIDLAWVMICLPTKSCLVSFVLFFPY
jgi:hypothetical protein